QDKKKSKQDRESVFQDKTTIPNLDDPLNNPEYFRKQKNIVVHDETMTPDEYLERVTKGFDGTLERTIQDIDSDIVDKYAEDMKSGDKFPMLSIDQSGGYFNQEGRHRALAAKKAGINQVPVRIKTDADKQGGQQRTSLENAKSKRTKPLKRIRLSEKVQDENGRKGTINLGNADQA
ncbi:MAG: hypothetical protein GY814_20420, partial [Gammaproteobacteria bacterium]|nr:hypothetical protein [Gammaproteobacteria bacterium]